MSKLDPATIAGMGATLAPDLPQGLLVAVARKESNGNAALVDHYATGAKVPDDEIDWADTGKKYTVGLFQCSSAELRDYSGNAAGYVAALQDPSLNMLVYAHALKKYITDVRSRGWDGASSDGWAFVALGHNMGLARLREKLTLIDGVNWSAFIERYKGTTLSSGYDATRWVNYGQAVIDEIEGSRILPGEVGDVIDAAEETLAEAGIDPLVGAALIVGLLYWSYA
jgi:hypothetical protein